MGELAFVDTHVHFNDFKLKPELQWSWLDVDFVHPVIGDIDGIKTEKYTAPEFQGESRFSNVTKVVHIQSAIGTPDPVAETVWLERMADKHGLPNAIVGEARLQRPEARETLERHAQHPHVRGVRDFGDHPDYLTDPAFERGYALLEEYRFLYDLDCVWETMGAARDLAGRHPGTTMVVEHAGWPRARSPSYFEDWSRALRDLAQVENVVVKISGLGMSDPRWTIDSLRPWILECIDAFGVDRAFFGTNWPVDRLFSSYPDVINAYAAIISDFALDEQLSMFSANAERIYAI
ncbi:MAG: amidohydrolase family protein [Acidimicrobiia bacterium]